MALGARPSTILGSVLGETMVVVLAGIGLGIPMVLAGTRPLRARLFELSPHDPAAVAAAVVVLFAVALVAGFLPARRAAGIDPVVALRYE
jgi:ABC-type antimicrobial peptide transport system permease subunit